MRADQSRKGVAGPTMAKMPHVPGDSSHPEDAAASLHSWSDILSGGERGLELREIRRQARRRYRMLIAFALVVFLAGAGSILTPFTLQWIDQYEQARRVSRTNTSANMWPYPREKRALEKAAAYNRRLAASGQRIIGERGDPFSNRPGVSQSNDNADSASANDKEYQSLLNEGGGMMGSISIPKISVNLPIYHGTSSRVLLKGAGHLYGTSLPIGGKSTHAVITGHTGMVGALMFTRLDELKIGQSFYITSMGRTIGYKIDRRIIIQPTDFSHLYITKGEDRVTLLTCYPYGINTQRLLVSGVRAKIPSGVPYEKDAGPDLVVITAWIVGILLLLLLPIFSWIGRRNRWWPQRHGREWVAPLVVRGKDAARLRSKDRLVQRRLALAPSRAEARAHAAARTAASPVGADDRRAAAETASARVK